MVVASTLSFLAVNRKLDSLSKGDLVRMAMKNETRVGKIYRSVSHVYMLKSFVGVNSGG